MNTGANHSFVIYKFHIPSTSLELYIYHLEVISVLFQTTSCNLSFLRVTREVARSHSPSVDHFSMRNTDQHYSLP